MFNMSLLGNIEILLRDLFSLQLPRKTLGKSAEVSSGGIKRGGG